MRNIFLFSFSFVSFGGASLCLLFCSNGFYFVGSDRAAGVAEVAVDVSEDGSDLIVGELLGGHGIVEFLAIYDQFA